MSSTFSSSLRALCALCAKPSLHFGEHTFLGTPKPSVRTEYTENAKGRTKLGTPHFGAACLLWKRRASGVIAG